MPSKIIHNLKCEFQVVLSKIKWVLIEKGKRRLGWLFVLKFRIFYFHRKNFLNPLKFQPPKLMKIRKLIIRIAWRRNTFISSFNLNPMKWFENQGEKGGLDLLLTEPISHSIRLLCWKITHFLRETEIKKWKILKKVSCSNFSPPPLSNKKFNFVVIFYKGGCEALLLFKRRGETWIKLFSWKITTLREGAEIGKKKVSTIKGTPYHLGENDWKISHCISTGSMATDLARPDDLNVKYFIWI